MWTGWASIDPNVDVLTFGVRRDVYTVYARVGLLYVRGADGEPALPGGVARSLVVQYIYIHRRDAYAMHAKLGLIYVRGAGGVYIDRVLNRQPPGPHPLIIEMILVDRPCTMGVPCPGGLLSIFL